MKNLFMTASFLAFACGASAAYADNTDVENAIKSRPDLSSFYQELIATGVNHDLIPGQSYTIFAPTNGAFSEIHQKQYPCFYKAECQAEVAAIIRNHIIPGEVRIDDAVKHEGGLFSIGSRLVNIAAPSKDNYAVDGNKVISTSSFGSGILYKIDGVIANPHELALLQDEEYASTTKEDTIISKKTISDPACGPGGCADETTQTTTITRTVLDAPALDPTR